MRTRCLVLFAALLCMWPAVGVAQAIQGRVIDTGTRQPVATVELNLVQGERVVARAVSDSLGRFMLYAATAGSYHLTASRVGYADAKTQTLQLNVEQTVLAELELSVTAVPIAPLTVTAARDPYLESTGFYERMRTGNGYYMTDKQIQAKAAGTIVDVLRSARGVKIQRVNSRQEVYLTSPSCLPQIIVDGMTVRWGGGIAAPMAGRTAAASQPLEDLIKVSHIDAIEVYRAFNGVPPQYVGPNAQCGTILIWTRHR